MKIRKLILLGLATLAMLVVAAGSTACPVCFGDSDEPIAKGIEASVIFMVAVTYGLLSTGVLAFFLLRRRARRLATEQNLNPSS